MRLTLRGCYRPLLLQQEVIRLIYGLSLGHVKQEDFL